MFTLSLSGKAGREVPTETLQVFHAKLATEVLLVQALNHPLLQLTIASSLQQCDCFCLH